MKWSCHGVTASDMTYNHYNSLIINYIFHETYGSCHGMTHTYDDDCRATPWRGPTNLDNAMVINYIIHLRPNSLGY